MIHLQSPWRAERRPNSPYSLQSVVTNTKDRAVVTCWRPSSPCLSTVNSRASFLSTIALVVSTILTAARRVSAVNTRMCLSREQSAPRHKDSAYSYMNCSLTFFSSRINRSVQTWSDRETPKHNITNRGGAFLNTLNMTNVYLFSFSE